MEQEKILSTLNEKLGETSFSTQTLQKYIELNPVPEGKEPDEIYFNTAVGFLKGMQGQYNHDVATEIEGFKKNYKPQQDSAPASDGTGDASLEKKMREMEAKILQFEKENEAAKKAASIQDLKKKSRDLLKSQIENGGKNACNEEILNIAISDVEINEDMKIDDIIGCAKRNYEKRYKAIFGEGASPVINQFAETGEEQAKNRRKSFKELMISRGKLPKTQ